MRKILAAVAGLLPAVLVAAPMSNEDVLRLVAAGVDDMVIVEAIAKAEPRFDVSTDALIRLKQGGATSAVIARVITASAPGAPAGGNFGRPVSVGGCATAGVGVITVKGDGVQGPVGYRKARKVANSSGFGRGLAAIATFGIVTMHKRTEFAVLAGDASERRYKSGAVEFSGLVVERGLAPADGIKLVVLSVGGVDASSGRNVPIGEGSVSYWGSAEGTLAHAPLPGHTRELKFERVESDCRLGDKQVAVWKAAMVEPLEAGEYALMMDPDRYHDFAVEEPPEPPAKPSRRWFSSDPFKGDGAAAGVGAK